MATPFITEAQTIQKIQEALAGSTPGGGGIGGTNYVFVQANGTPEENATELQEVYDTAKTMSPSATNKVTVIVSPGEYKFPTRFVMDTQFVDLISLTGNKDVIFDLQGITDPFDGNGEEKIVSECLYVNADNVYVRGIKGKFYMSPGWDSYMGEGEEYNLPIHIASNLPNIVIEKCEGGVSSFNDGLYGNTILNGTFIDCIGMLYSFGYNNSDNAVASGTFIDCVGGDRSFGGTEASGTFENCQGGVYSFGGNATTVSGTFENCQGGIFSFGGSSATLSGTFTNCVGGNYSFGGYSSDGTEVSGTFINCRGGNTSFGSSYATLSGTFIDCVGGDRSFGSNIGTLSGIFKNCVGGIDSFGSNRGTLSGIFEKCQSGDYSFGGNSGTVSGTFVNCVGGNSSFGITLSGKLYYCRLTTGEFRTVSSGGRTYYCVDGNGDVNNQ